MRLAEVVLMHQPIRFTEARTLPPTYDGAMGAGSRRGESPEGPESRVLVTRAIDKACDPHRKVVGQNAQMHAGHATAGIPVDVGSRLRLPWRNEQKGRRVNGHPDPRTGGRSNLLRHVVQAYVIDRI